MVQAGDTQSSLARESVKITDPQVHGCALALTATHTHMHKASQSHVHSLTPGISPEGIARRQKHPVVGQCVSASLKRHPDNALPTLTANSQEYVSTNQIMICFYKRETDYRYFMS